jgi:hypothetical protein
VNFPRAVQLASECIYHDSIGRFEVELLRKFIFYLTSLKLSIHFKGRVASARLKSGTISPRTEPTRPRLISVSSLLLLSKSPQISILHQHRRVGQQQQYPARRSRIIKSTLSSRWNLLGLSLLFCENSVVLVRMLLTSSRVR